MILDFFINPNVVPWIFIILILAIIFLLFRIQLLRDDFNRMISLRTMSVKSGKLELLTNSRESKGELGITDIGQRAVLNSIEVEGINRKINDIWEKYENLLHRVKMAEEQSRQHNMYLPPIFSAIKTSSNREETISVMKRSYSDLVAEITLNNDVTSDELRKLREDIQGYITLFESADFTDASQKLKEMDAANQHAAPKQQSPVNDPTSEPAAEPLELQQPEIPQPPNPRLFGVTRKDDG